MHIIEIAPLDNGAHRNQNGGLSTIPAGWAIIPKDIIIPSSFPFVNITVEGNIVTSMVEAPVPEPAEQPQPKPTIEEEVAALKTAVQMLCLPDKEVS